MTPLVRTDFQLHAVKLLSSAFNDVRTVGKGKNQKVNFCTKARYHSVLSKLDLPERKNADMVAAMFIAGEKTNIGIMIVSENVAGSGQSSHRS